MTKTTNQNVGKSNHLDKRAIFSWSLYDWANSAFATTVMAGFFPVFFGILCGDQVDDATVTFRLGLVNSLASLVVAIIAPILGAVADSCGGRKRFLAGFACLGAICAAGLYYVPGDGWLLAGWLFGIASIGFAGGNIFYDSLIVSVAPENKRDFVSNLGYSMGYLGGGLLFLVNVVMTLKPELFGFANADLAVRISFWSVGAWWLLFSIPILLFVREPSVRKPVSIQVIRQGLKDIRETFSELRVHKQAFTFLIAYWLYIDGVDTIVRMAVDYGKSLGFETGALITALLITQFVGFPAALGYAWLGQKIGARKGIFIAVGVYALVSLLAGFMTTEKHFYVLAIVVGLVQGGVQALSRSMYSRLIPPDKSSQFFGFYNMLGKFAAVLGPLLMALVAAVTGDTRISIMSLFLLFAGGAYMLTKVQEPVAPSA